MIGKLIARTAWPMTPPAPWSPFHIILSLLGLAWSMCLTRLLCRKYSSGDFQGSGTGADRAAFILWTCGLILAASELYKQLFLYQVVNNGRYDWWYFPFQLCSTPMYLCLVYPLLPQGRPRKAAAVYLQSFGFLGGVMALLEPSGLMHPYWTLTLHGLLWHVMLIFIGLFVTASGLADRNLRSFLWTLPLFWVFCLTATAVNILTGGLADMFYISPYYPVTQAVFHEISLAAGILPGIAVYLISICVGAALCRLLLNRLYPERENFPGTL